MKKFQLFFVSVLLLFALAACTNSGWFVDKSQPWQDDAGHWHTQASCGTHPTTHYVDMLASDDRSDDIDGYSESYYYTHMRHYHSHRSHNQTYITIPVTVPEYSCIYV